MAGTRAELALFESTDLHSYVLSFDYFNNTEDSSLGFERLATLIRQGRKEFPDSLLFDDGDTIQGSALAEYQARVRPISCNQELAIYKAMDAVHYDGGTIANHDFDFGLPYLSRVTGTPFDLAGLPDLHCAGPHFPLVLSNLFRQSDRRPLFPPSLLISRTLRGTTPDGAIREVTVKVGIIGLVPPEIMRWNRSNLAGRVYIDPPIQTAEELIPKLRAQGADVVVVLSHGGIDPAPGAASTENFSWYLSKVPGIDVLLLGHAHKLFPGSTDPGSGYARIPGVDNVRGTLNGVPAVMGGFLGKGLGLIRLALRYDGERWSVDREHTRSEVRLSRQADGRSIAPDPEISKLVATEHAATIGYFNTPIGDTSFRITSYFAEVGDVAAVQLVNMAQRDYARRYVVANLPQYAALPIVSTAAPFKTGFGGPIDYTDILAGTLSVRSAAQLYFNDNALAVVKVNGAELVAWLETAARHFNRIDPRRRAPQPLINRDVPAYNFDVLQGDVSYVIDVHQPIGRRIRALRHCGRPVQATQEFLVATSSYRANGGGSFPGLDGTKIIFSSDRFIHELLIDYVRKTKHIFRSAAAGDRSWRFAKIKTAGPVTFRSRSKQSAVARDAGLQEVKQVKGEGNGMATYLLKLGR